MTDQKETPVPQRRQAEGDTGVRVTPRSVPGWTRKRVSRTLLRFNGEYITPEALHAQARAEASQESLQRVWVQPTVTAPTDEAARAAEGHTGASTAQRVATSLKTSSFVRYNPETGEIDPASLPCRSLETTQYNTLTGAHRKTAAALSWNVDHLCKKYGPDRIGFLTLTFADHVLDPKEAQRRFNSLAVNVLKTRYLDYIRVMERQKSGRIHYHLLVVLPDDIRTGFDFSAVKRQDYKSANNHLRREWAFWRKTSPQYRFGRTELMPIKGSSQALGQYVGKYIGKHLGARVEADKGARLVTYTRGARMATSRHTAIGKNNTNQWRGKVETFARQMTESFAHTHPWRPPIRCVKDLSFYLGPKWAFQWREYIFSLPPADLEIPF